MNQPTLQETTPLNDVARRLVFQKDLQRISNKIHATRNIDEIMLELSQEICTLFNAERLTIYAVAEDGYNIVAKIKTGLTAFRELKVPIGNQSIAGYVALNKKTVCIDNPYDDEELRRKAPGATFLHEVDRRTGFRTRQMLVIPILESGDKLLGVFQILNPHDNLPFPSWAVEGANDLAVTLAVAFVQRQRQPNWPRSRYDALVSRGTLTPAQFEAAHTQARESGSDLEAVLIADFGVKFAEIGAALAEFFGVPYEPFRNDRIKPTALLRHLKRRFAEESGCLPLEDGPEGIVVVSPDPERIKSARIAENIYHKQKIVYRVTTHAEFHQLLDLFFGGLSDLDNVGELLSGMAEDEAAIDLGSSGSDDVSAASDNELVRLVNRIIVEAHQKGASDIHIEPSPGKDKTRVRFRIDGSLVPYIEIPGSMRSALVARIKIMCDLDISEKRKPQDGKIKFKKFCPLDIELRVATLPMAGGVEDVVMRILAAGEPIVLSELGLSKRNHDALLSCITKPYGLFFVCGPTGSGKTTTLHSVLGHLNTPDTKILTAEDPVEITQKGLRQVQVNKKAGLDFPTVMRAFLRSDPDIIMVGEMRDAETTSIGIEASLTGHLVFATLHTNSAPESVIRLLDMGMDPFNFADALLGILAQRLAKRLCKHCRQPYQPDEAEFEHLVDEYCSELTHTQRWQADPLSARESIRLEWLARHADKSGRITLYRPKGCEACNNSGYKGRLGLHELMVGTDPVKKLIQERERVALILAQALEDGMRTLKMDGIEKVLQGITDLAQVRAVCIK